MFAVIFRAKIRTQDETYLALAEEMRQRARDIYGCIEFVSFTEGDEELTISYWHDEEQIKAWKNDPQHRQAQQYGRDKVYEYYKVEITQLVRSYQGKM